MRVYKQLGYQYMFYKQIYDLKKSGAKNDETKGKWHEWLPRKNQLITDKLIWLLWILSATCNCYQKLAAKTNMCEHDGVTCGTRKH